MSSLLSSIKRAPDITEHQRLQLRVEYFKTIATVFAVLVPLVALVATVIVNVVLARARERTDFELKAAEIVMTASSPAAAKNKAAVLVELFPSRLPSSFASTLARLYDDSQLPEPAPKP
jgi:hypothetical protein